MPTWHEVITRFATRKPNPSKGGKVIWSATPASSSGMWGSGGGTVVRAFCDEGTLYSYGRHFVLARYLGEKDGRPIFLKNGDASTATTRKQQAEVQSQCYGPTVAFSALAMSREVEPDRLSLEEIVDWREDKRASMYYVPKAYKDVEPGYYRTFDYRAGRPCTPAERPAQGMFIPNGRRGPDTDVVDGIWHVLGAAVIRGREADYLCSLDEGNYFVSKLPGRVDNVDDAFQVLKPPLVKVAEDAGCDVRRQGEWFFIKAADSDAEMAAYLGTSKTALRRKARPTPLPQDRADSNRHVVAHLAVGQGDDSRLFARGKVFHRERWSNRLSREHATLNLGDAWYEVVANTQLAAWSMGGRFD